MLIGQNFISTQLPPANRQLAGLGLKDILGLLPNSVELVYVDYRDEIGKHQMKAAQQCIHDGDWGPLYEEIEDWMHECSSYTISEMEDQLRYELAAMIDDLFDLDGEGEDADELAELIFDQFADEIRDAIYDRDESTPIKDLLRHTPDQAFFYDPGYGEITGYPDDPIEEVAALKKMLGIAAKDDRWDKPLYEAVSNAGGGGKPVIFFEDSLDNWIGYDMTQAVGNTIVFENPHVCIMNAWEGSGWYSQLDGFTLAVPFNRRNLFLDRTMHYSFTYDVCGEGAYMWRGTGVRVTNVDDQAEVEPSELNAHIEQQAQYDKTFRAGGCTFGDMDITRHRNTPYRNDFPCGSKCTACGTFWID